MQDVFASVVTNHSTTGFVVDIGCQGPGKGNNSTLFLEKGWEGVGADIQDYQSSWTSYPNYKFYKIDTTVKSNVDLLFETCPDIIDFLSLDVDGASLSTLQNIDLDKFKFKCICIEHDYYANGESLRAPQREILEKKYTRVIQTAAEDWYVDFSLLSDETIQLLSDIPPHHEITESEMHNIPTWLNVEAKY